MNTHEYQAKKILKKYGIPVPDFEVVSSLDEVETLLKTKGWTSAVLKVQIHAGGRGKAGGVHFAKSQGEIRKYAKELIGKKIVNEQTGAGGLYAHQLLISEPLDIAKEYYLAYTIDREKASIIMIASPVGGMDIEKIAKETPEKVLLLTVPLEGKLRSYQLIQLSKFMGWKGEVASQGQTIAVKLLEAFIATDATLFEINPFVATPDGKLLALDAKLAIDENALFRQPDLKALFDSSQVSKQEAEAQKYDLAYVALDGDVGCMVNGAGLAMATMDIIQAYGRRPANFLDVGGGASQEKVAEGFRIILSDPKVKAILVNIFGGIMNCETLALGIVEAAKKQHITVPLVVRMEGTNVEKGKQILAESNLNIQIVDSLDEAAKAVVHEVSLMGK